MTDVTKIIEIVGNSDKSWEEAAQAAVFEAKKNVKWYTWNRSKEYDCNSK